MDPLDAFMQTIDPEILRSAESSRENEELSTSTASAQLGAFEGYENILPGNWSDAIEEILTKTSSCIQQSSNTGFHPKTIQKSDLKLRLIKDPCCFLVQFGQFLDVFDLKVLSEAFSSSCPTVKQHVQQLRQIHIMQAKTSSTLGNSVTRTEKQRYERPRTTQARNRRFEWVKKQLKFSDTYKEATAAESTSTSTGDAKQNELSKVQICAEAYFGVESARERHPHLYYEVLGQYIPGEKAPASISNCKSQKNKKEATASGKDGEEEVSSGSDTEDDDSDEEEEEVRLPCDMTFATYLCESLQFLHQDGGARRRGGDGAPPLPWAPPAAAHERGRGRLSGGGGGNSSSCGGGGGEEAGLPRPPRAPPTAAGPTEGAQPSSDAGGKESAAKGAHWGDLSCRDETKRVCSLHCMAHATSSDRYVPSSYFNFYNAGNREGEHRKRTVAPSIKLGALSGHSDGAFRQASQEWDDGVVQQLNEYKKGLSGSSTRPKIAVSISALAKKKIEGSKNVKPVSCQSPPSPIIYQHSQQAPGHRKPFRHSLADGGQALFHGAFPMDIDKTAEKEDKKKYYQNSNTQSANEEQPKVTPQFLEEQLEQLQHILVERFLDGADHEFVNYAQIDNDVELDNIEEAIRMAEDTYFEEDGGGVDRHKSNN